MNRNNVITLCSVLFLNSCCLFSTSQYCKRKELYKSSAVCQRSETVCGKAKELRKLYREAGIPKDKNLINLEIECAHSYEGCQEVLGNNSYSQECCNDANFQ